MSAFRTPNKVVGRCPVIGCYHVRIFFEEDAKTPANVRAISALARHVRKQHPAFIDAVTRKYIRDWCVR